MSFPNTPTYSRIRWPGKTGNDPAAEPIAAAVVEDALAGVEAGRAGRFGWVVGVDRSGDGDALRDRGADVVVKDLGVLL